MPCLVRKYCVADVIDFCVDVSHCLTLQCRCVCFFEGSCFGFGRPDSFYGLVQGTFWCIGGLWILLGYIALVEHYPSYEVPCLYCLDPCGFNWVPTHCVHIIYFLFCSWQIIDAVGFLEELLGFFGWRSRLPVSFCLH